MKSLIYLANFQAINDGKADTHYSNQLNVIFYLKTKPNLYQIYLLKITIPT